MGGIKYHGLKAIFFVACTHLPTNLRLIFHQIIDHQNQVLFQTLINFVVLILSCANLVLDHYLIQKLSGTKALF